jgi:hypothetical protein
MNPKTNKFAPKALKDLHAAIASEIAQSKRLLESRWTPTK